ncbi:MAG: uracil-DNA glycosylase family protein [Acidiferrobacteraceae bacterium]
MSISRPLATLLREIRACRACTDLPLGPNPILRAASSARLLIVGQAPGIHVHRTGVPWNDASGNRLRDWMGITSSEFYDERHIAIVPMGLCYPGTGPRGDCPPRSLCSRLWFDRLHELLPDIALTLLIGRHAQRHYLGQRCHRSLTDTVRAFREYLPRYLPLPHPSGRNNGWLTSNPWFERRVLPELRTSVQLLLRR